MSMENITESVTPPDASGNNKLDMYASKMKNWLASIYMTLSTRINWLLNRYAFKSFSFTDNPIDVNDSISFYLVDTSAGDVTANVPSADKNTGIMFHFKNTGTGILTIDAVELIDNCDTIELIEMETITIVSDGTKYWIVP
jgi:hypothetical protein